MGDLKNAREYYNTSYKIKVAHYGKDHIENADTLNNIGQIYFDNGDLDTTLKYYLECLEI